ncbi:hypothetical protein LguiB_020624 [Lonicera macranthoides]
MVTIEEVLEVKVAVAASLAGDHHICRWKYDVFLSFRGEDTRKTFVDHLYSALVRSGIYTFKDDVRLKTGETISPALLKAIEESSFAVIVFSKNYASSRWCLDELVKIMECSSKSPKGQTVIPVFYDVKPSEVREQKGHFGEMHESKFINQIVQEIWSKLPSKINVEDEGLVGMKSRIEKVTPLLGEESNVVRTVGIWGLSGIGKSMLAGSHEWFGPGSRIIITTRDRKLLALRNEVQIHEVSVLDYVEATKLFQWKAFNDMCPAKDFEELSVQVIDYCDGLPLALKVLGSALHGEDLDFWKDSLRKLREDTENIEGILLHPPLEQECTIEMATEAFRKMAKLRLLEIHNTCIPKGLDYLPNELRWIDWDKYPSSSLPSTFEADVLVGLQLVAVGLNNFGREER